MHYKKLITPLAIATMTFTSAFAYADIGFKHKDKHKRDKNTPTTQINETPFDYNDVSTLLNILNQGAVEEHLGQHIEQADLESLGQLDAFTEAFEEGDELFEIEFNALDGVGINVGNGKRFSSIPRLDLTGDMAWANVLPTRATGPNGNSCLSCHNQPISDGAGGVNDNTIRIDPERIQSGFIERQAPHIFGLGGLQLLAEEMTTELQLLRDQAIIDSCKTKTRLSISMTAKDINFGSLHVLCKRINYRDLAGIDKDLVVKPFEWKGLTAFTRDFVRGAAHQELGMQATELVADKDLDFDGITNEFTVGDITALSIYSAGQQRPVTTLELNQVITQLTLEERETYGLPLSLTEIQSIERGSEVFSDMQCASCHTPALTVNTPRFYEPSLHTDYRDEIFPAGEEIPLPNVAIEFDITEDIFVNPLELSSGQTLGEFEKDENGSAIVRLYGDMKRHDMGAPLAEDFDEGNVGASVFLTENLWGVASTAPYLHDGRATTLTEAIMYHGGDAQDSKNLFANASQDNQEDLLAFLNSLVLYLEGE
ncbi:di-heme oxidoredictase family protein [uncultured Paraglaciecola sp.]|uniref:di-heme oxidoredictase family protein n=1 Tax=uncultured Paraglaciecola sp. TaxID=1765024 RepID=UPI0025997B81|nr:di-heme oxidoredictase family protein [uncultured Paraglaciecola sp.]